MALEDMASFYGKPAPFNFIVRGGSLADRFSILSARSNNTSGIATAAPAAVGRRVRRVAGPSVATTSYFSKETSGASYFVDDYFGVS